MKRFLSAAIAAFVLAACTTATPYQPYQSGGFREPSGGFSEVKVSSDRYRVTFAGNGITPRETVERYLLFRAAELTVAEGYDWFALADRRTERDMISSGYVRDPYYYWRPTWFYSGRGQWIMWDPWGPDPFWHSRRDVNPSYRYQATAEIFLGRGPKPANDPSAFNAREVIQNLGPTIVRPS